MRATSSMSNGAFERRVELMRQSTERDGSSLRSRCGLADGLAVRGPGFWLVEHRDCANMATNFMPDILRAELIACAGFAHDRNAVTIPETLYLRRSHGRSDGQRLAW